ncbi:CNNM domain-containing protein [Campylobacter cuniculorum]|uniref:DUF21 domain-containing protein n=2 Tax=Campylobacter cuniculorum TaxID=374106 RepID=A0ABX6TZB8_9BACT|nr:CNNM domain-containing protein [Campylobacter cuniculorum]ARJ56958.1 putative hemolysin (DUF21 domain) [Campylobacter cuniculorum DSM 23162 = LMG 24588]QOR04412.1 DUF21 domain-containing protein [Campylobacter cuniculorum]
MFWLIFYFLLAVVVSFICSILEAVLLSITPSFMESYARKHLKSGKIIKHLKANIDNSIGAILVVNTFANTVGAAGVGAQAVEIFGETWQGFVALFMTLCILYFSEILPKTIGATYYKILVLPASYCIVFLYCLTFPLVYISRIITYAFKKNKNNQMTRDEILAITELGEKSGSINELESDILEHLLLQKNLSVKDIMTPKERIFALDEQTSIEESLKKLKFSRIPLYDEKNQINSLVYKQNILQKSLENKEKQTLKSIAKTITKVDSNMALLDLLEKFITQKEHLFLVVEKTQTEKIIGIVSLNDVIEAVLGVRNLQRED